MRNLSILWTYEEPRNLTYLRETDPREVRTCECGRLVLEISVALAIS
jgi:hypothetical protein